MKEFNKFVSGIDRFLKKHKIAPSRFGRSVMNDPHLVTDLKRNPPRLVNLRTMEKVNKFMASYEAKECRN